MTTPRKAQTPLILYFLAFLVVGAIWWLWRDARVAPAAQHRHWEENELSSAEISEALNSPEADQICHALVQLRSRLVAKEEIEQAWLQEQSQKLAPLLVRKETAIRNCLAYCLAYWPGEAPEQVKILKTLLADEEGMVSLNAAIALAARQNAAGADRIAQAIRDTKGEQVEMRRHLLANFRYVAQPSHTDFLKNELERAQLDHDEERVGYCQEALQRAQESEK